jgi:hypothetical protein
MNIKNLESYCRESSNCKEIDPKLWDRLIWQEAIDKALKRERDRQSKVNAEPLSKPNEKQNY